VIIIVRTSYFPCRPKMCLSTLSPGRSASACALAAASLGGPAAVLGPADILMAEQGACATVLGSIYATSLNRTSVTQGWSCLGAFRPVIVWLIFSPLSK
jgi:hypothetical protein